ncbi:MAG: hypothetical protein IJU43_03985 [Lachnospiraceae bacterium]|nr:hypothetical protein [Lachnospiraceae bacterium]
MKYKGRIIITLKSDLCIGSGYAYAGIVDSDVCYDGCGIPYIPGKRLKGCFRETANSYLHSLYNDKFISGLFGERGQKESSKITIGNAFVNGYDEISKVLKYKIKQEPQKYNQQSILEQYSRVIGQTKLTESGSADEGSLRYTRVVNHYVPGIPSKELSFEALIKADLSDLEKNALENIIRATKSIGLKRNRGLGSVSIEVLLEEDKREIPDTSIGDAEGACVISYMIINRDPLMLSNESTNESENYIPASNVIGALAGRYLSITGKSAGDAEFKDMFLNGRSQYTNLYPSVNGKDFFPAPEYINSMKKSKKIVNLLDESEKNRIWGIQGKDYEENDEVKDYSWRNGNQPKKLKGKYVCLDRDNKIAIVEVDKEIVYHHSHYIDNADGTQGLLYAMEVVSPEQTFAGRIKVPQKYKNLIKALLMQGDFYFGKSKTAQYGRCELVGEPIDEQTNTDKTQYNAEEKIVVTLRSDAIFMTERKDKKKNPMDEGAFTVYADEVPGIIANALGIGDADIDYSQTYIKTGKATGYMSVWNLRKPSMPVVKAGSAFTYTLRSAAELSDEDVIGERCLEGYGQITVNRVSDMHYKMETIVDDRQPDVSDKWIGGVAKAICEEIEVEYWLSKEKLSFVGKKIPIKKAAGLGRITLMLKESLGESNDYKRQFVLFSERVESISENNKLRGEALDVLKWFGKKSGNKWEFTWLSGESQSDYLLERKRSYWGECLMTALIVSKYEHKEES